MFSFALLKKNPVLQVYVIVLFIAGGLAAEKAGTEKFMFCQYHILIQFNIKSYLMATFQL